MSWIIIITLILIGLLLITLEILVLPGFVVGIIGGAMLIFGIIQAYVSYGTDAGNITVLSVIFLSIISTVIIFKTGLWKKISLTTEIDGRVNLIDKEKVKVGDRGKAISKLAVAGKALINSEYYEVFSTGEYIDAGAEIEVVKVDNCKIYVKEIS